MLTGPATKWEIEDYSEKAYKVHYWFSPLVNTFIYLPKTAARLIDYPNGQQALFIQNWLYQKNYRFLECPDLLAEITK